MQQDELIQALETALTSQDIPEITQTLLNLAEFMEHCDKVHMGKFPSFCVFKHLLQRGYKPCVTPTPYALYHHVVLPYSLSVIPIL